MDLQHLYNNLSLLILAASVLAILGPRISTGPGARQVELFREFRASLEQTSRNCLRARSAALEREFKGHDDGPFGLAMNVFPLGTTRLAGRYYVEESDRLIRTLASLSRDSDDIQVRHLRQRLKELKRIHVESVRLLSALDNDRK